MTENSIELGEGALTEVAPEIIRDTIDLVRQDQMTWITHNGKRVAAIVPVDAAEEIEKVRIRFPFGLPEKLNYNDARKALRAACLDLLEGQIAGIHGIIQAEYENARRQYRVNRGEEVEGEWEVWPDHCGQNEPCAAAGKWGATGNMPNGHLWVWRNAQHTSGYLAHCGTGSRG